MENEAIWFRQFGTPETVLTLESSPLPLRSAGMLRVKMCFAPINPSDLIPVTGAYRHRVFPPRIAGYEGVGIVTESDMVEWVGKRVLPLRGEGTWQRWLDCSPRWAVPVPDEISDDLAARGYINPLAAWLMLKKWPVTGRRVLISAAGSSCAALLAQWAWKQGAIEVTGIYRSPQHLAALEKQRVITVSIENDAAVAQAAQRADVVYDAVGGKLAALVLDNLGPQAAFVSYGLLSGQPFSPRGRHILAQRFHLRDTLAVTPEREWQQWFVSMWKALALCDLPGVTTFPLTDWSQALMLFRQPGRLNKPLLVL